MTKSEAKFGIKSGFMSEIQSGVQSEAKFGIKSEEPTMNIDDQVIINFNPKFWEQSLASVRNEVYHQVDEQLGNKVHDQVYDQAHYQVWVKVEISQ